MSGTPPVCRSDQSQMSQTRADDATKDVRTTVTRPNNSTEPSCCPRGLHIRGLVVRYGDTRAVDAVDCDVTPGEIIALLGPSGSGKSSLLRAVAGLEGVAEGTIQWDGKDIVHVPVHKRGFGLMFQDGQLFAHRDVAGNVAYGLRHMPRAQRAERVKESLALVGMSEYARRAVTSLSGGQAQRVALARSIAPRPSLLLLDEPLSALDRSLREHLSGEIRSILRSCGSTCVYVTHDQDEAFAVADRIGVMIDGRLAALDRPENLWAEPRSRAVASFLGHGPFLCAGAGLWRAVTPGALTLFTGETTDSEETQTSAETLSCLPEVVAAGGKLHIRAEVIQARPARGRTDVDVLLEGQVARAQIPQTHAAVVCAGALVGRRVPLLLDLDVCPLVTDGDVQDHSERLPSTEPDPEMTRPSRQ